MDNVAVRYRAMICPNGLRTPMQCVLPLHAQALTGIERIMDVLLRKLVCHDPMYLYGGPCLVSAFWTNCYGKLETVVSAKTIFVLAQRFDVLKKALPRSCT